MDGYIDTRFERLERSLANLIDSIAKYNPSLAQSNELRASDAELKRGLEKREWILTSTMRRGRLG